jgi:hypothetical protein
MYRVSILLLLCITLIPLHTVAADKPARAVLMVIDGLHWQAPERLGLENIQKLAAQGSYIEQAWCIVPYHPFTGAWSEIHTCSMPNPILFAGTLFLKPDHPMIQHSFYEDGQTANVVNSLSYITMNRGFHFSMMVPPTTPDSIPVEEAIRLLREEDIRFLRLHLQNTGNAGNQCAETEEDVPWRHNIWGKGSPYVAAAHRADKLLGEFVAAVKQMGKWDNMLLVVTADHGQSPSGWHPLLPEDSWITPLMFIGPNVARGKTIPYAEHIDIVPTICDLMGVDAPNNGPGSGRIIEEVKSDITGSVGTRPRFQKELNEILKAHRKLTARMILLAEEYPILENAVLRLNREFYGLDRIMEWHETGSLTALIQHNRAILDRLQEALDESPAGK